MKTMFTKAVIKAKAKVMQFIKEERSGRGSVEEAFLTYAGIAIGIGALLISMQFMGLSFNDIGNFLLDGVNGRINEGGLGQWQQHTNGFNKR